MKALQGYKRTMIPLTRAASWFLDLFFPKRCIGCNIFDTWLCDACHARLPLVTEQKCPVCVRVITPEGTVCLPCLQSEHPAISGVFVVSLYNDQLLKTIIHHFKYRFIRDLGAPLAVLAAQGIKHATLPAPDIMIPVPLHPRRLRWRGFNQAHELIQQLDLTIPIDTTTLLRKRFTTSQVKKKSRKKRQENLAGAFIVTDKSAITGKNILLVDDVVTTGTTLEECAKALKSAGASTVTALVLARE